MSCLHIVLLGKQLGNTQTVICKEMVLRTETSNVNSNIENIITIKYMNDHKIQRGHKIYKWKKVFKCLNCYLRNPCSINVFQRLIELKVKANSVSQYRLWSEKKCAIYSSIVYTTFFNCLPFNFTYTHSLIFINIYFGIKDKAKDVTKCSF